MQAGQRFGNVDNEDVRSPISLPELKRILDSTESLVSCVSRGFHSICAEARIGGIVAKRSDSIYIPGKESDAWRKHRFNQEDGFVIGGYIPGRQNFSELLIGEERDKELVFIKRLTAGFVPHTRAEVFDTIKGLKTTKCPFSNLPESRRNQYAMTEEVMRQCVWIKPECRCEVEFVERTKGGRLRHAEFRRLLC